ncbi:3-beta-hydroxysteroid-Delta(8),Delta(7)-isomerase [Diplodia seriata]|uniref:3-beta-hydroxysteroid-Delta(8), Delta(7)-isomerase n=1 Tax=Diplodia seriata TaxID=420778 RepID=A0A1S8BB20_9PEZI|nr:3-beta-hydroxysteroid-Delta(8),Delta(7)-isomerase [Diplodia seriata]
MAPHPYYPLDLKLHGYTENAAGLASLFAGFSTGVSVILGTALFLSRRYRPSINARDGCLVLWFVLSGSLHCFFEGYFLVNHSRMPAAQDFFGQLWKEYAKSDSRYLAADPLVLTLETITVLIWGPLSFLTSWCIVSESPYRLPLQALVSTGHLYSDTLYYVTSFLDMRRGVLHSRPEALYFWVYFVVMNALWIIVPACKWIRTTTDMRGDMTNDCYQISSTKVSRGAPRRSPRLKGRPRRARRQDPARKTRE